MPSSITFRIITEAQVEQAQALKTALEGVQSVVREINRSNSSLNFGGLKNVGRDASKASDGIDKLSGSLENFSDKSAESERHVQSLGGKFESLGTHAGSARDALKDIYKDFERVEKAIQKTSKAVATMDRNMDKAGDSDLDEGLKRTEKRLESLTSLARQFDKEFSGLGAKMSKGIPKDLFAGDRDAETFKTALRGIPKLISDIDKQSERSKAIQDQLASARKKMSDATQDAALAERKYNQVLLSTTASEKELAQALSAHNRAQDNMKSAKKDLEAISNEYENMGKSVNEAQRKVKILRDAMKAEGGGDLFTKGQKAVIDKLEDSLDSLGRNFKKNAKDIRNEWSNTMREFGTQSAAVRGLDSIREKAEAFSKFRFDHVTASIGNTTSALTKSTNAIVKQVNEMSRLDAQTDRIVSAVGRWHNAEAQIPNILNKGNAALLERARLERTYSGIYSDMRGGRNAIESRLQSMVENEREAARELEAIWTRLGQAQERLSQQKEGSSGYLRTQKQIEDLTSAYKNQEQALAMNLQTQDRMKNQLRETDTMIDRFNSSWGEMRRQMTLKPTDFAGTLINGMRKAISAARELADALGNRLRSAIQVVANTARAFANSVGSLFSGLQRAVQGIGNVFTGLGNKIQASMEKSKQSMLEVTAAGYSLMTIGSQIQQFGMQGFRNIGRGFSDYMEYERARTQAAIAAAQELPGGGFQVNAGVIDTMIREMQHGDLTPEWISDFTGGKPIPVTFNAKELAEGAYFYSSAIGMPITQENYKDIAGTLTTIMQMAKVTGTGVETAIKGVMNVAMEFGYDPRSTNREDQRDISKIAAQMGYLANISTMETTDIVEMMKMVGPMANVISGGGKGAGLTETFLMSMLASEVGLRGGNVGRGVSQAFTGLLDPTKKMIEVAGKYFENVTDEASFKAQFFEGGALKGGIMGLLEQLSNRGLSGADQAAFLAELFTSNATRSMLGSTIGFDAGKAGGMDIDEFIKRMEGDDPFQWLAQAAAETANTVSGWYDFMQNGWFQFQAAIVGSVSGPLKGAFRVIGELFFQLADNIHKFPAIGAAIAAIVTGISALAAIGGTALIAAGSILILGRTFMTMGGFVVPFIRLFAMAGATLLALLPAIALIGVAVVALGAAWKRDFLGMRTAYENFRNNFDLDTDLEPMITKAIASLAVLGRAFGEFVNNILLGGAGGLGNLSLVFNKLFGETLGQGLLARLVGLKGALSGVNQSFASAFGDVKLYEVRVSDLGKTIQGFLEQTFMGKMSAESMSAISRLGEALGLEMGKAIPMIASAGDAFRGFLEVLVSGAAIVIGVWQNMVGQIHANLLRIIQAANFGSVFETFSTLVTSIASGMALAFSIVLGTIVAVTDKIADMAESLNKAGATGRKFLGITINMQNAVKALGVALGVAFGVNLLMRFGPFVALITKVIPLITGMAASVIGLAGRFVVLAAQILITVGAWAAQAAVMLTVLAVKGLLLAAGIALAAVGATQAASSALAAAGFAGEGAAAVATTVAETALAAVKAVLSGEALILAAALGVVAAVLFGVVGAAVAAAGAIVALVVGFGLLLAVVGLVVAVIGAIIAIFATAVAGVLLLGTAISEGLGAAFKGLVSFVQGAISGFSFFIPIISAVVSAIMGLVGFIGQLFGVGDAFKFLGIAAGVGLGLAVTGIMLLVAGLAILASVVILPFALLVAAIMGVVDAIRHIDDAFRASIDGIQAAWGALPGFFADLGLGISYAFLAAIDSMVNGAISGVNKIMEAVTSVPDWVPGIGGKGGWSPISYDSNLAAPIEVKIQARADAREADALQAKVTKLAKGAVSKVMVAVTGRGGAEPQSQLTKILDKVGLLDEATAVAKKYNIDIETAGIEDVQKIVSELMQVPDAASKIEAVNLNEVLMSPEDIKARVDAWEQYNKEIDKLVENGNMTREQAEKRVRQNYEEQGLTIPVEPTEWEKMLNQQALDDGAAEVKKTIEDIQNALTSLKDMSPEDYFGALFDPLTGQQGGKSFASWLAGQGGETILGNIPEGSAPWMNQTELMADFAASGAPGGANIYGKNLQQFIKDSGALDVLSQQSGIPVEVLIEGIPKFVNPGGFEGVVMADMYQIIQGMDNTELKFRPSVGIDMTDFSFLDTQLGVDVGMTDAGIEWAELNSYAVGQAIAGVDWNLADYIAESWGWSVQQANEYLAKNNIDPSIITSEMYDGLNQAVISGNGQYAAITEKAYSDLAALTNNFENDVITMSQDTWAQLPDSYKALLKQLGITTIVSDTLEDMGVNATQKAQELNAKFTDIFTNMGTIVAAGVDGVMTGSVESWNQVGEYFTDATGQLMVTLQDLDGTQITIPAAEYEGYKQSLEDIKNITDTAAEYMEEANRRFNQAKEDFKSGNLGGGIMNLGIGGVNYAMGAVKEGQANQMKENFGLPENAKLKVTVDDSEVKAIQQTVEAVVGPAGSPKEYKIKIGADMQAFASTVTPILQQYQKVDMKIPVKADMQDFAGAVSPILQQYQQTEVKIKVSGDMSLFGATVTPILNQYEALTPKIHVSADMSTFATVVSSIMSQYEAVETLIKVNADVYPFTALVDGIISNYQTKSVVIDVKAQTSNLSEAADALQRINNALAGLGSGKELSIVANASNLTETATALRQISDAMSNLAGGGEITFVANATNLSETANALTRISDAMSSIGGGGTLTFTADAAGLSEAATNLGTMDFLLTSILGKASMTVSVTVSETGSAEVEAAIATVFSWASGINRVWTATVIQTGASTAQSTIELATGAATAFAVTWTATIQQTGATPATIAIGIATAAARAFAQTWTATLSVNNYASSAIASVSNELANLNGRSATVTITTVMNTVTTKGATGGRVGSAGMMSRNGLTMGEHGWTGLYASQLVGRATGGRVMPGELTLVGERGPELVTLPVGSYVHTARETEQMFRNSMLTNNSNPFAAAESGGNIGTVNVNNNMNGDTNINVYGDIHIGDKNTADNFFEELDRRGGRRTQLIRRGMYGSDTDVM